MTTAVTDIPKGTAAKSAANALRIAVIIVHYKTPGMLKECVATISAEAGFESSGSQPDHVIVVDNDSGAEQVAGLAELRGNGAVTLIESGENLGFAGANNLAIEQVRKKGGADYYLLLNPDTLVRAGAISRLVEFLEKHPEAACVGPRLEDLDGTPQQSAFGFPNPWSEFLRGASVGVLSRMFKGSRVYGPIYEGAVATDWLAGACVLMRNSMVEKAGLLDDGFFMYFEEVDYFRRAREAGQQAWYEPAARVVHLVGRSSGVTVAPGQKRLPGYWFESRHRYFRKHYGYIGMVLADWFWVNGYILDRLRKMVTGTSHAAVAKGELGDLLRHGLRQMLHPFGHDGGKR